MEPAGVAPGVRRQRAGLWEDGREGRPGRGSWEKPGVWGDLGRAGRSLEEALVGGDGREPARCVGGGTQDTPRPTGTEASLNQPVGGMDRA